MTVIDDLSFRWSGGVYVSRKGQLAVMNTERRRNEGDNDYVNGEVYKEDLGIDHAIFTNSPEAKAARLPYRPAARLGTTHVNPQTILI